jgi:hypothetical protein
MKLRAPFALIALIGWSIAWAPAVAAGTTTLHVDDSSYMNGEYLVLSYSQNDHSFKVTTPLSTASARILNFRPGEFFNGTLVDNQGQTIVKYEVTTCGVENASSGSDGNVHFEFKCLQLTVGTIPLATPSPSPTPTPKPTPTPMLKLVEPLAHPAVKN